MFYLCLGACHGLLLAVDFSDARLTSSSKHQYWTQSQVLSRYQYHFALHYFLLSLDLSEDIYIHIVFVSFLIDSFWINS